MALVLKDRVKEQSTTTGTGTLTLSGAFDGYQAFSVIGNGNVTYYTIYDPASGDWEVGYGTYTLSGTTLSRTFVYDSSNSGNLVPFTTGTKEVFCTYPSEQAVYQETNGNLKLVGGVIGLSQDGTEGTTLPNTSFQAFTTGNYYMQANQQNLSSGTEASSDYICTADNGSDTDNYIDVGMASSGYNFPDYSAQKANSGYVMSTGSDLRLIAGKYGAVTPGGQDIVLIAGSTKDTEERVRVYGDTAVVHFTQTMTGPSKGQTLTLKFRYMDVFVLRDGRWQCVSSQSTRVTALDPADEVASRLAKECLDRVLKSMDERERKVVELRFGLKGEHPRTLAEVSSRFNVSRERIRQIEAKALEQIKAADEIQAMRESA